MASTNQILFSRDKVHHMNSDNSSNNQKEVLIYSLFLQEYCVFSFIFQMSSFHLEISEEKKRFLKSHSAFYMETGFNENRSS